MDYLAHMGEGFESSIVGFSGKTKSKNLQDVFETKLTRIRKTLLGPSWGKKIFFIDDVNMPQLDTYGS